MVCIPNSDPRKPNEPKVLGKGAQQASLRERDSPSIEKVEEIVQDEKITEEIPEKTVAAKIEDAPVVEELPSSDLVKTLKLVFLFHYFHLLR